MSRKDAAAAGAESPARFDNLDEFFKDCGSHDGSGVYDWLKDYDAIDKVEFSIYSLFEGFAPKFLAYEPSLDVQDFDGLTRAQKTGFIIAHFMDGAIKLLKQEDKLPQHVNSFLKLSDCEDPNMERVLCSMSGWIRAWVENHRTNYPHCALIQGSAYSLYRDAVKRVEAQQAVGRYTKAAKPPKSAKPAVTVARSTVSTFGGSAAAAAAASSDHSKGFNA
jgi:uncharacterized protein YgiB involved in biofilm formation